MSFLVNLFLLSKQVVFQLSTELAAKTANREEFELILYDARREIQGFSAR